MRLAFVRAVDKDIACQPEQLPEQRDVHQTVFPQKGDVLRQHGAVEKHIQRILMVADVNGLSRRTQRR